MCQCRVCENCPSADTYFRSRATEIYTSPGANSAAPRRDILAFLPPLNLHLEEALLRFAFTASLGYNNWKKSRSIESTVLGYKSRGIRLLGNQSSSSSSEGGAASRGKKTKQPPGHGRLRPTQVGRLSPARRYENLLYQPGRSEGRPRSRILSDSGGPRFSQGRIVCASALTPQHLPLFSPFSRLAPPSAKSTSEFRSAIPTAKTLSSGSSSASGRCTRESSRRASRPTSSWWTPSKTLTVSSLGPTTAARGPSFSCSSPRVSSPPTRTSPSCATTLASRRSPRSLIAFTFPSPVGEPARL